MDENGVEWRAGGWRMKETQGGEGYEGTEMNRGRRNEVYRGK